ncbi:glycosyltransferase [Francisella sp. 19X1-34]|uniref:glycosyltransferase n=1 Tax=Francisella sp. 19X1-34 TaxID=3087177 RepID=UPI002E2F8D0F|nr:glycosyltransferase [Francisella sp. 19X1-34]MED7788138.1 glycosyltransferase [Francisella sp. 19X1-34]
MEKVAAFIAGDKNIIDASFYVFKSLFDYNKSIDAFICLPSGSYTNEDVSKLKSIGVKLLDLEDDNLFSGFKAWPKEVFLNFAIPDKLYHLGYEVAIKLDYDVLIQGNLDVEKNTPKSIFKATRGFQKFDHVILNYRDFYKQEFNLTEETMSKPAISFGCVFINLKEYYEKEFWNKFCDVYKRIITKSPDKTNKSVFSELGTIAITLETYGFGFEVLEDKYNYFVSSTRHIGHTKFMFDPIVMHYSGRKKPWRKVEFIRYIINPYNCFYLQKWYDYEYPDNKNTFKSKFIKSGFYKGYVLVFTKIMKMLGI